MPNGKPPFGKRQSMEEILQEYGVPIVEAPREKELCDLDNPLAPLWDYQNSNIEHRDPHLGAISNFLMYVGDIYRTITDDVPQFWYLHEKAEARLGFIHRMTEDFNIAGLKNDITPELLEGFRSYLKGLEKWEEIVENYPTCQYETEKTMMLKSIELDKDLVQFVLGGMRGLESLKKKVDKYRDEIFFLYPERKKKPTESAKHYESDMDSSKHIREEWCKHKRGAWDDEKKVCEITEPID